MHTAPFEINKFTGSYAMQQSADVTELHSQRSHPDSYKDEGVHICKTPDRLEQFFAATEIAKLEMGTMHQTNCQTLRRVFPVAFG